MEENLNAVYCRNTFWGGFALFIVAWWMNLGFLIVGGPVFMGPVLTSGTGVAVFVLNILFWHRYSAV